MRPVKRIETIELLIPALSPATRFNFPDIPQLRSDVEKDIWVRGLSTYTVDTVTLDFNGNPVATFANMQTATLTLYMQGAESVFRLPLVDILNTYQEATIAATGWTSRKLEADNWQIDWTKSYITTPVAFGNAAAFAFIFKIEYYKLPPATMQAIKRAYKIPDEFDIVPGLPMPSLTFGGNYVTSGSMQ